MPDMKPGLLNEIELLRQREERLHKLTTGPIGDKTAHEVIVSLRMKVGLAMRYLRRLAASGADLAREAVNELSHWGDNDEAVCAAINDLLASVNGRLPPDSSDSVLVEAAHLYRLQQALGTRVEA